MEKLELKHLANAMVNNQKVLYFDDESELTHMCKIVELREDELTITNGEFDYEVSFYDIKLLSLPLSLLTKEIEYGGERFVPIIELYNLKTQIGSGIYHDYYIENNTAILRFKGINFDEFQFRKYFEIDLEPNQVMFSIVTETWKDDELQQEIINLCGNEMLMFEKLKEWHFDISGLIEKDLAVDINTLSE